MINWNDKFKNQDLFYYYEMKSISFVLNSMIYTYWIYFNNTCNMFGHFLNNLPKNTP